MRAAAVGSGEPDHTTPRPPLHLSPVFQTACAWANVGSALACLAAQLSSDDWEPNFKENVELIAFTNAFVPVTSGVLFGVVIGVLLVFIGVLLCVDIGVLLCVDIGVLLCVDIGVLLVVIGVLLCVDIGVLLCVDIGVLLFVDIGVSSSITDVIFGVGGIFK
jgi:hypothetical protein